MASCTIIGVDEDAPALVSLDRLVEDVGPDLLRIAAAPAGLAAPVTDVVIQEVGQPVSIHAGELVLILGAPLGSPEVAACVQDAAAARASAVVIKGSGPELADLATDDEVGLCVLVTPPETEWGHLFSLLRAAVATGRYTLDSDPYASDSNNLFSVANAVAQLVGGPVVISDAGFRLLAYSAADTEVDTARRESIIRRRAPRAAIDRMRAEGVLARLFNGEVIRFGGGDPAVWRRTAVAIRAGEDVLAMIWVLGDEEVLGDDLEARMRTAEAMVARYLARHPLDEGLRRRMQANLVRGLLEGSVDPPLAADRLGTNEDGLFVVMAVETAAEGDDLQRVTSGARLLQLLDTAFAAYRVRGWSVLLGDVVYTLLELEQSADAELAQRLYERATGSTRSPLRGGIGDTVEHLSRVAASRNAADRVLRVMRERKREGIATVADVQPQLVIQRLREIAAAQPELFTGKIATLARHDDTEGTELVATLTAYLRAGGNVRTAAEHLVVHPNTLRYRLKRIREVVGLDLDDPDDRFVAEIQLRLR